MNKLPRLGIADAMILVALVALDLGVVREVLDMVAREHDSGLALMFGAVPAGNVLAVGLLVGGRRRDVRPFLGFGAGALAVFVAVAGLWPTSLYSGLEVVLGCLPETSPLIPAAAVVVFLVPQLALALIGGLIFRRFRSLPAPDRLTPERSP